MRCRRLFLALSLTVPLVVGVAPAHAQFGGVLKKVPKPPALPGAPATPAPSKATGPEAVLTADLVGRMIECMKLERKVLEQGIGEARKKAAEAADGQQEKQMALMQSMMERQQKYQECLDAAMLKDKETPKLERLQDQAEDETEDAKADELNRQASALEDAIRKRAEPACASLKVDMAGEMQAAQAQQARQESEQEMMSRVDEEAEEAAAKACKLPVEEYARILETLCVGSLREGSVHPADEAHIQARSADLKPALEALGCSAKGFPWGERIPPIK